MYRIHKKFRDGHMTYYAGEQVSADNFTPDSLQQFAGYGWLSPLNAEPVDTPTGVDSTLNIHDAVIGHTSETQE